jgi:hypothetical protein
MPVTFPGMEAHNRSRTKAFHRPISVRTSAARLGVRKGVPNPQPDGGDNISEEPLCFGVRMLYVYNTFSSIFFITVGGWRLGVAFSSFLCETQEQKKVFRDSILKVSETTPNPPTTNPQTPLPEHSASILVRVLFLSTFPSKAAYQSLHCPMCRRNIPECNIALWYPKADADRYGLPVHLSVPRKYPVLR